MAMEVFNKFEPNYFLISPKVLSVCSDDFMELLNFKFKFYSSKIFYQLSLIYLNHLYS